MNEQTQNIDGLISADEDLDGSSQALLDSGCEAGRPERTLALTRGLVRYFLELGHSPLTEFRLASGRRADVAALDRKGFLTIVEVKSCLADFESDLKWTDYRNYCDQFYFCIDADFPSNVLPSDEGLMLGDAFGACMVRQAPVRKLVAARRKAVTLRFAHQAARRIKVLNDIKEI